MKQKKKKGVQGELVFPTFLFAKFCRDSLTNFVGTISTLHISTNPISSLAIHKQSALGFRTVPSACFGRVFGLLCGGVSDPKGTVKMGMILFAPVSCRIRHDQNPKTGHARYSDMPNTGRSHSRSLGPEHQANSHAINNNLTKITMEKVHKVHIYNR